jgi:hypothetical protein
MKNYLPLPKNKEKDKQTITNLKKVLNVSDGG